MCYIAQILPREWNSIAVFEVTELSGLAAFLDFESDGEDGVNSVIIVSRYSGLIIRFNQR